MAFSWGCGGEGEELLVQENAQEDTTYKVTCPDTSLLSVIVAYSSKFKELQFPKSNKGTVVLYIPFTLPERHLCI